MNRNLVIKGALEKKLEQMNCQEYIQQTPLEVVHTMVSRPYTTFRDIELCAMFTSLVSVSREAVNVRNASKLMDMCDWHPYEWLMSEGYSSIPDNEIISPRLRGVEFKRICRNLMDAYQRGSSMHDILKEIYINGGGIDEVVEYLDSMLTIDRERVCGTPSRSRICILLRWMVRPSLPDLGIWNFISPSDLYAVINVKKLRQTRQLGLVDYKCISWSAVGQLTENYKKWDRTDPLKYDIALSMLKKGDRI